MKHKPESLIFSPDMELALGDLEHRKELDYLIGKVFVRTDVNQDDVSKGLFKILFAGIVMSQYPLSKGITDQMWECELAVYPRRKFKSDIFLGWRIDQVLTSGWMDSKVWTPISTSSRKK